MTTIIFGLADGLGKKFISLLDYSINLIALIYQSTKVSVKRMKEHSFFEIFKVIMSQIYFTGYQAVFLVSMLALITGTLAIIQSSAQLSKVGGGAMLGNLLVILMIREIGPLVTALIVVARSGTAVASELGNMRVNCEIQALESMGINPLSYIVFPRLVGGVLSILCLAFIFCFVALFGGYIVSNFITPISFKFYTDSIAYAITYTDVILFLIKNIVSGIIIFGVCCYQGLQVKQSFTEVPQVTTKAVVNSIVFTVGLNTIISISVYIQNLKKLGIL